MADVGWKYKRRTSVLLEVIEVIPLEGLESEFHLNLSEISVQQEF